MRITKSLSFLAFRHGWPVAARGLKTGTKQEASAVFQPLDQADHYPELARRGHANVTRKLLVGGETSARCLIENNIVEKPAAIKNHHAHRGMPEFPFLM